MENQELSAVSLAIARGDVALWLGPDWRPPVAADGHRIQAVDWLGVWIECPNAGLIETNTVAPQTQSGRLIIEVDNRIEDVLGKHFSVADICPHFYLSGHGTTQSAPSPRQRRMSRDEKVQQLSRLKTSVMIIAGYADPNALAEHLAEISEAAPDCRLLVVTGLQNDGFVDRFEFNFREKIVPTSEPLSVLLSTVEQRRAALPPYPTIRVGNGSVALDRLLRAEPPLDQDFLILKEHDIRDPELGENVEELLVTLVSGRAPAWRSFAHQIEWRRPLPHRRDALKRLNELRRGPAKVSCWNIPAESGAGLTTLLHQIAFDAAREGAPTFIHRAQGELDYDRLRSFLTDLHTSVEGRSVANEPSIVIFDSDSVRADSTGELRTIASRMARDGRRVLFIRGIPLRSAAEFNEEFKKLHRSLRQGEAFEEAWAPLLRADLDDSQQQSLLRWASERFEKVGKTMPSSATTVIQSWKSNAGNVPLLIFLYSILSGTLREAAGLGRHLVRQFLSLIQEHKIDRSGTESDDDEQLTGNRLLAAIAKLDKQWHRLSVTSPPTLDELSSVLISLAAMGCLRLGIPRSILADLISIQPAHALDVVSRLEAWNLVSTDLLALSIDEDSGTLAPAAFYTRQDSVGLVHPSYGRLILEWLNTPEAATERQTLAANGLTDRFLNSTDVQELQSGFPLRLLEPIFRSLKPTEPHVRFAEDIAMRYLRLQKGRLQGGQQEELTRWQWKHTDLLRDAFTWLDEQVVRQSASLLHSRGITTYKSCRPILKLTEARTRYFAAANDFERAIDLVRSGGSDRPVHIMSSLGLLYLFWLQRERDAGFHDRAAELDRKVEQTLRAALAETSEVNSYAVYGLASYLVSRYERTASDVNSTLASSAATDLAEVIELMQIEPEAYFEDEWNELRSKAVGLLGNSAARRIIEQLKQERNELGYALAALQRLDGLIPEVPTEEPQEVENIRAAATILREAQDSTLRNRSHLADLLRYALYSADPDRLKEPAYRQRFDLIGKLIASRYLDIPIWLYDYAMLCFQVGQFGEGADAFSRLRKGKRFFEVSRDRSCWLSESPDSLKQAQVFLRVISVEGPEGKAWGRVEHPRRFRDPVPLSVRSFRSRGTAIQVGHSVTCQISLNPAGPFAEPPGGKDA